MTDLVLPFEHVQSERCVLRKMEDTDFKGYIDLYSDPQVRSYLGGPIPPERLQTRLVAHGIASVTSNPGDFIIADRLSNEMVGMVTLERREAHRPGHTAESANELELSYLLRRGWWGQGLAFEAASLLLHVTAAHLPDQPVVVVTQTENKSSLALAQRLGFEHATTFREFDADQWLGVRQLHKLCYSS